MDGFRSLLLLILLASRLTMPLPVNVDMIEINAVDGRFTQIILWVWSPDYHRYHAAKWWLVQEGFKARRQAEGYEVVESGKVYRAKVYLETTTKCDMEIEDQKFFSVGYRKGL